MNILLVDTDCIITESVQMALNIKKANWKIYTIDPNDQFLELTENHNCHDYYIRAIVDSNGQ
jgi:hypothetical protein